jgi:hypothetical protein
MGIEGYRHEHGMHHRSGFRWSLFLFFIFIIVLGGIVFTSFYDGSSLFTGRAVDFSNNTDSSYFYSELSIPSINIKGSYDEISIVANSDSSIYVGNKEFSFSNLGSNNLVLKNFSGRVSLNENNIYELDGRSEGVFLNGLSISGKDGKSVKVGAISDIGYTSLDFKGDVYLKEIAYVATGNIFLMENKQNKFVLDNDFLTIEDFMGSIDVNNKKIYFEGFFGRINIEGGLLDIDIRNN